MQFVFLAPTHAKRGPVGLLIQAQGEVFHSYRGNNQKKVYRNMFLFNGSIVITEKGSTCRLIDHVNSKLIELSENTEIQMIEQGVHVVKGNITEGPINGGVLNGFRRKYNRAQRYSSIQRSAHVKFDFVFKTAASITISKKYPEIVWENVGAEYHYRLYVAGKKYVVEPSKTDNEIVRYSLAELQPGQYSYKIEVVEKDNVVTFSDPGNQIVMLSDREQQEIDDSGLCLKDFGENNFFLQAYHLDEKGLKVAAMDLFQKYSSQHKTNNDTRMFLIKTYNDLELTKRKTKEMLYFYQFLED